MFFLMAVATIGLFSCTSRQENKPIGGIFDEANLPAAEKLIKKAMNVYDSSLILALADSLEKVGDISATKACYYRGAGCMLFHISCRDKYGIP